MSASGLQTITPPPSTAMPATPAGGFSSAGAVLPLVYDQLKAVARARMALERRAGAGHTLQATAVVHEAFARLSRPGESPATNAHTWSGRREFFMAAAREIERVLVDHARHRYALKRGGDPTQGGHVRIPLDVVELAQEESGVAVALQDVLLRLEEQDPQAAAVVRLRFFLGLTTPETALALGISDRTVVREWTFARAFLAAELQES